jgi:riboflavin biosynthesis pyrimidine reductase
MRWLLPDPGPPTDLEQAYGWPAPRWVRGCMVMGLDGSYAGEDGLSGSISSATDRRVLGQIRRYADAWLVGAQTVRAEQYGPVRANPEAAAVRVASGQAPVPTLAIVSASCRFDWESAAFTDSDSRPLILTTAASDPADRAQAARWCDVVVAGEQRVDPGDALQVLSERGLTRVTCEGGDALLSAVIRAGLLDELDLTLSPMLTQAPRSARPGPPIQVGMRLAHLMEDDGHLFARYVREG